MSHIYAARKLGSAVRIGRQLFTEKSARTRAWGALLRAAGTTARSFGHVLHLLWLEVTGAVFLAMAAMGGLNAVHQYRKYEAGQATPERVLIPVAFTLTFAWFGVSSFWRVRRKARLRQ
ncbi:MAG TPA: hypothetical protein VIW68_07165 [Candidatus Sulfotelmatobacter sp.]